VQPYVNAGMTTRTARGFPRKPIPVPDLGVGKPSAQRRKPASTIADALAPLSDTQIQTQARNAVTAQTAPILDQIRKMFETRSTNGSAAITGYTKELAADLSQYMDRAKATYGRAETDQAKVNAATSSELHGGGGDVAKALADRLGSAGLDPAMVASLAADANATGAGSAGAGYAKGSAELSKLIGEGAHAQDYAAKLPGIASTGGLQRLKDFQAGLTDDETTQVGNVTAGVPAAVASLLNSFRNTELQKAIARRSGLLQGQQVKVAAAKTKADANYRTKTLTERQRHDQAQEQAARDRIAAQKQAAADTAAGKAAAAAKTASTGRQKAFYATRDKVFNQAKQLYKGDTSNAAPWESGGSTGTGPATSAEDAYAKLWQQYAVPLIAEQGFKKSALDTMIRRALRSAGFKA
jgi:hypothetical protein